MQASAASSGPRAYPTRPSADVIERLRREDDRFHVEGGSWTNDQSWVRGYDRVLIPMEQASSLFHERVLARGVPSDDPRYRKALFHLLAAETSCFRYGARASGLTTAPSCPVGPPTSSPTPSETP
jgi:hypothetical protein